MTTDLGIGIVKSENPFVERLLRLADKLEGKGPYEKYGPIPHEHFDIRSFYNFPRELYLASEHVQNISEYKCGTSACAVGWATLDPWFNEKGLQSAYSQSDIYLIKFDGLYDWRAIEEFFGLDEDEAEDLFTLDSNYGNNDPLVVAERIREVVSRKFGS